MRKDCKTTILREGFGIRTLLAHQLWTYQRACSFCGPNCPGPATYIQYLPLTTLTTAEATPRIDPNVMLVSRNTSNTLNLYLSRLYCIHNRWNIAPIATTKHNKREHPKLIDNLDGRHCALTNALNLYVYAKYNRTTDTLFCQLSIFLLQPPIFQCFL